MATIIEHELTVQVTDSNGASSQATITIAVVDENGYTETEII